MASAKTNLKGRTVYVVDGGRTPFLKAMGPPGPFHASDLAVQAGRLLLSRQPFEPEELDEVILGCVSSGPDEANIARIVALRLGCGQRVPAWTVQRNCASAMQSLDCAATNIATGRSDLVLAGGTEAMSHHPLLLNEKMVAWLAGWNKARGLPARACQLAKLRPAYLQPIIALLRGLTDPVVGISMGQTAEELAWIYGINRKEMDSYAAQSHQRLAAAQKAGHLDEIEPLYAPNGTLHMNDEGLRAGTTVDKLAGLKPFFDRTVGMVTAGNSSQITDGAAWLLLASNTAVKRHTSCRCWARLWIASGLDWIPHRWASVQCTPWLPYSNATALQPRISISGRSMRPLPPRSWPASRPGVTRSIAAISSA